MQDSQFVDHYEVLQCSPDASLKTIEGLFIDLARIYHPDVPDSGNKEKFEQISEAFETLRIPEKRQEFDAMYATTSAKKQGSSTSNSLSIDKDSGERFELLKMFYAKRREDIKAPGMSTTGLMDVVPYSQAVLDFHLWYFVEKGWLKRQDGGRLAITADGVDKLEAASLDEVQKLASLAIAKEAAVLK